MLENLRVIKIKDTLSRFFDDGKIPPNAYWKVLKSVRGRWKTKISSFLKKDCIEVFSEEQMKIEIIGEFKHRLYITFQWRKRSK